MSGDKPSTAACAFHYGTPVSTCPSCIAAQGKAQPATAAGPAADHHPTIEGRCCNGLCRRKQPPMVMRSALTGTWYVVTRYKHLGDGRFEAIEKHLLARESGDQLEALTNG